jgi:hypothetical protein
LPRVTPTVAMPDPTTRRRAAALADIADALSTARCATHLAGVQTTDFVVRELLLAVTEQLDRAVGAARRLV